jgi:hypothetical protein
MSFLRKLTPTAASLLLAAAASAQPARRDPAIGYLYPAGLRRGTKARIAVGGQYLTGPAEVHVTGPGVKASVVKYMRPIFNIQREQRLKLISQMAAVREERLKEAGVGPLVLKRVRAQAERATASLKKSVERDKIKIEDVKIPDHPLLTDLDSKSLREMLHIREFLFFPRSKLQTNRQLAETVLIEVTVDRDAPPGDRQLRLRTRTGLTNPVVFQVGQFREVRELEPNDRRGDPGVAKAPVLRMLPKLRQLFESKPLDLPVLLNGQTMPGDVDRFGFRARKGQRLVIEVSARRLIPYLADAVPGWFQATVTLYDVDGKEVAFADDYRFEPDPVLLYEVPKDGVYELAIRDAIYRGRQDFVYRIAIGEQPYVTQVFPLGGKAGSKTVASIDGWNLPARRLPLDTAPEGDSIRQASCRSGKLVSNAVTYAVDTLDECLESASNDTIRTAQRMEMPKIVNGRIEKPGDVDVFRIEASAGQAIVAEVHARRLGSPLDSMLRLMDAAGKVLAWNDDHVLKQEHLHLDEVGRITHHADSYLSAKLPDSGTYYVQVSDAQHHGSDAHAYRLRISRPRPDFELRVTPSSIQVRPGAVVPISVYAIRRDGFDGEIDLKVASPAGFRLQGGRIPAGRTSMRMTLTAPARPARGKTFQPTALKLEGVARCGGRTLRRAAGAADNVMQAFLYRHLLPAEEVLVAVTKQRWATPPITLADDGPVRVPAGGSRRVRLKTTNTRFLKGMVLELNDPPDGLSLRDVSVASGGIQFDLAADAEAVKGGFADNLIVEAFRHYTPRDKDGKPRGKARRVSVGFLPAIPIEIVRN